MFLSTYRSSTVLRVLEAVLDNQDKTAANTSKSSSIRRSKEGERKCKSAGSGAGVPIPQGVARHRSSETTDPRRLVFPPRRVSTDVGVSDKRRDVTQRNPVQPVAPQPCKMAL